MPLASTSSTVPSMMVFPSDPSGMIDRAVTDVFARTDNGSSSGLPHVYWAKVAPGTRSDVWFP